MKGGRLRNRDRYLEEAMLFRDTDLIKVITGVRRCGKSSLLDLITVSYTHLTLPTTPYV